MNRDEGALDGRNDVYHLSSWCSACMNCELKLKEESRAKILEEKTFYLFLLISSNKKLSQKILSGCWSILIVVGTNKVSEYYHV